MDPKTGLYSKAAKLIRALPQERGTAEQMIAAARKAGLKQAELDNLRELPSGPITRERLAQTFEASLPRLQIDQYGENPRYNSNFATPPNVVTGEDEDEYGDPEPADPQYSGYTTTGGSGYRERLLRLDDNPAPDQRAKTQQILDSTKKRLDEVDRVHYGEDHPITQQTKARIAQLEDELRNAPPSSLAKAPPKMPYQSSHWSEHPNVLAHIRLMDRTSGEDRDSLRPAAERLAQHISEKTGRNVGVRDLSSGAAVVGESAGVITPEEAASLSRLMGWRSSPYYNKKGVGKRLLHVEEMQSDWAQEGRDQGFNTGEARKAYDDHVEDMRARMRQALLDQGMREELAKPLYEGSAPWQLAKYHGEADQQKLTELDKAAYAEATKKMPPPAPYVQNTQHWTDLALKNVLREAALGNYDGIVFTPGQAQADRYSLDKHVQSLSLKRPADGNSFGRLTAMSRIGTPLFDDEIKDEKHLHSLVGRDVADKLLSSQGVVNHNEQTINHYISGGDLKMGGQGMRTYYDNMVPKSVMNLARMHDPEIKPADPVPLMQDDESYQGFHLPMTDKLRQGILNEGFPAMKRGGRVDDALAITRRFTKDGAGAMMRLKP